MSTAPPRPLCILVVEDHEDSALALAHLLRRDGNDVHVAGGFADALTRAVALPTIDVLICDITLRDGNGCDLLPLLRGRKAGGVTAAVAVTGHTSPEWIEKCRAAGFETFLPKPVAFADLLSAVRAAAGAVSG